MPREHFLDQHHRNAGTPNSQRQRGLDCDGSEAHILARRQKQIMFIENTRGYINLQSLLDRGEIDPDDVPSKPSMLQNCSARCWQQQIRRWRRALHAFDFVDFCSEEQTLEICMSLRGDHHRWSGGPDSSPAGCSPGYSPRSLSASPTSHGAHLVYTCDSVASRGCYNCEEILVLADFQSVPETDIPEMRSSPFAENDGSENKLFGILLHSPQTCQGPCSAASDSDEGSAPGLHINAISGLETLSADSRSASPDAVADQDALSASPVVGECPVTPTQHRSEDHLEHCTKTSDLSLRPPSFFCGLDYSSPHCYGYY
eukprot:NODE_543_length_2118_cov_33.847753_g501_i0.p1 GENE.NODE_543_length_2118_cov_33.847753_g501_i0~~NODE_543_length_2118_cov_33.847753_g501_i0.p1  ORF type:complete len:315 (-),score=36.41 NODE_543_length_2118_cov_33.847753_g501_i0:1100-2044(-)